MGLGQGAVAGVVTAMDPAFWNGKRVFLTGHTGFKGSWLSLWLVSLGAEVTGYALAPPTSPSLFQLAGIDRLVHDIRGDIRDLDALAAAMTRARPDILIHMAAQSLVRPGYDDPVGTYATNVMGTVHVLEAARRCDGLRAALMVTTDKCYENREWAWGYREDEAMGGFDPYSSSKGCAELVTAAYRRSFFASGTQVASARAGNVIGGGDWARDRLVPDVVAALLRGESALIRNPDSIRPWQHVLEPLAGYLVLCQRLWEQPDQFAEGWNFGPAEDDARPVRWIADRLCARWGDGAAWHTEAVAQPHEAHTLKLDCSKARARLGWRPRWGLDTALDTIVDWYGGQARGGDARALAEGQIRDYMAAERE